MKTMLKNAIRPHLLNGRGWRTTRKLLVIQSDDWGAVRTTSSAALNALERAGITVRKCHYTRFDALEGSGDLNGLFDVLASVRDSNGTPAKLTANCLVANPDFDAIEKEDYSRYIPELVSATFDREERTKGGQRLWLEGRGAGLFYPQSHSREHFNVARWMRYLQSGDEYFRLLFKHRMYALSSFLLPGKPPSYLSALQIPASGEPDERARILADGFKMFRDILGFDSTSFIAPNYVWDDYVEEVLHRLGVDYIQTSASQQSTKLHRHTKTTRRFHGERNTNGQLYLLRNVHFEPSSDPAMDWVAKCMHEIAAAFFWRKPAILSTHRVNYIGALEQSNRETGLKQLEALLKAVVKRWPDVEFLSTVELGDQMLKELVTL